MSCFRRSFVFENNLIFGELVDSRHTIFWWTEFLLKQILEKFLAESPMRFSVFGVVRKKCSWTRSLANVSINSRFLPPLLLFNWILLTILSFVIALFVLYPFLSCSMLSWIHCPFCPIHPNLVSPLFSLNGSFSYILQKEGSTADLVTGQAHHRTENLHFPPALATSETSK